LRVAEMLAAHEMMLRCLHCYWIIDGSGLILIRDGWNRFFFISVRFLKKNSGFCLE